jgi:hypothetical protein
VTPRPTPKPTPEPTPKPTPKPTPVPAKDKAHPPCPQDTDLPPGHDKREGEDKGSCGRGNGQDKGDTNGGFILIAPIVGRAAWTARPLRLRGRSRSR